MSSFKNLFVLCMFAAAIGGCADTSAEAKKQQADAIAAAEPFCGPPARSGYRNCFALIGGTRGSGVLLGMDAYGGYHVAYSGSTMLSLWVPWEGTTRLYSPESSDGQHVVALFKDTF